MKVFTLRSRLIIITVLIVTATSALFAGGIVLIKQKLEAATFGNIVHEQIIALTDDPESEALLSSPLFKRWHYYSANNAKALPEAVQNLAPGAYHSVRLDDRYYHLQVVTTAQGKVFLLYDITEWELQEHTVLLMLAAGIVLVLAVALLITSKAADAILGPVKRLTQRLAGINPAERGVRLADDFKDSDIGQIAHAFDAYLQRIDRFVEREQSFTSAASHELRTPLSVMMGAVDIIEINQPDHKTARAVARIKRACSDMHAFIEAALILSREEDQTAKENSTTHLHKMIRSVIEDQQARIEAQRVQVQVTLPEQTVISAPESICKILVANLLRNALEHSAASNLFIALKGSRFSFHDNGQGIPANEIADVFQRRYTTKPGGFGLGLYMVRQICDRFGWEVTIESEMNQGTSVFIDFGQSVSQLTLVITADV